METKSVKWKIFVYSEKYLCILKNGPVLAHLFESAPTNQNLESRFSRALLAVPNSNRCSSVEIKKQTKRDKGSEQSENSSCSNNRRYCQRQRWVSTATKNIAGNIYTSGI